MNVPAGYELRPLVPDDAASVAELVNEFDRSYLDDPDVTSAEEVTGWWARIDLADNARAFTSGETLAAVGTLYDRREGMYDLDAYVRPGHQGRGLGGALIDWAEERSREAGMTSLRTSALAGDPAAKPLIEACGFAPIRHFYRMIADLEAPPPVPSWPVGFTVSTCGPEDERVVHAVTQEAFADHWGHEYHEFDEWQEYRRGYWDPSLVYLVRAADGEVAAVEVNAVRFGMGWVDTLGTLKPWRGRGLGRALLLHAFGELYRRGEHRIGLGVDAANETGATHLYESVGMRVAWQADVYEKRL